jgi:hypothetical protein
VQEKLAEYGLSIADLVGLTSDGASVMKATGKLLKIDHQLCLGTYDFIIIKCSYLKLLYL